MTISQATPNSLTASITPAAGTISDYSRFTVYACIDGETAPGCVKSAQCTPATQACATVTVTGLDAGIEYDVAAVATQTVEGVDDNSDPSTSVAVTLPYP